MVKGNLDVRKLAICGNQTKTELGIPADHAAFGDIALPSAFGPHVG